MENQNLENIKKAFDKVKEDINFLNHEILNLKTSLNELNLTLKNIKNELENVKKTKDDIPTIQHIFQHIN